MALSQKNWKWFPNDNPEPIAALAAENIAPVLADNSSILRLRITIHNSGADLTTAMGLEYSSDGSNWEAFGPSAEWNYANGLAVEGATVGSNKLSDSDQRRRYHESSTYSQDSFKGGAKNNEFDFSITPTATVLPGTTYYFRYLSASTPIDPVASYPTLATYSSVIDGTASASGSASQTGSGTAAASGSAGVNATGSAAATGVGDGTASGSATVEATGSGIQTAAGTAAVSVSTSAAASGAAAETGGGTADPSVSAAAEASGSQAVTGSGDAVATGVASGDANTVVQGSGATTAGGDVSISAGATVDATGSAAATAGGDATATIAADGSVAATGSAAATAGGDVSISAGATVDVSGSATGTGTGDAVPAGESVVIATGEGAQTAGGDVTTSGDATVGATGSDAATGGGSAVASGVFNALDAEFRNSRGEMVFSRAPRLAARDLATDQARIDSAGAVPWHGPVYRHDDIVGLPLRLTADELPAFRYFFLTAAHGRAFPFTYTDAKGNALSVKFADSRLPQITERAYNAYDCTVRLRVQ